MTERLVIEENKNDASQEMKRRRVISCSDESEPLLKPPINYFERYLNDKSLSDIVKYDKIDRKMIKKTLPYHFRNLSVVACSLQGIEVVIELKNDSELRGIVFESDGKLNITLKDATCTLPSGQSTSYDELFVRGKTVRYIHFPPTINVRAQVTEHFSKLARITKRSKPDLIKDRPKKKTADVAGRNKEVGNLEIVLSKSAHSDQSSNESDNAEDG
jgi:small nuclear ribonucleoprotein (snRNP)-like protein